MRHLLKLLLYQIHFSINLVRIISIKCKEKYSYLKYSINTCFVIFYHLRIIYYKLKLEEKNGITYFIQKLYNNIYPE